ncbi:hypothetical protein CBG46_09620 [Actinobacillus succinogenes]|uniref:B3/4 domain protein n=1 Tax=Actinobacillus succinogenes (strain ATCC 55618 / DSM 22257 / CCUG 43843 / 130Z) TaxID=339671 RepID=A6VNW5_ACTSZ|nr:phenylalanine--tRNA ligase beta subunit-related protein [Actinobacillus succinogenes]ABR74662.1 B3/4 domain protein [Actinobacillus succinogenes 130Z]PHI40915.1 hypothetical protein CBG46_09620 [Actinobacillus succinogenes]
MKFKIAAEIFEKLPHFCAGVVVVKGFDNRKHYPEIDALLEQAVAAAEQRFADVKVKESPLITPYRNAFQALDINPNKFQCSAEALFTRIAKGKGLPHINPLVDLNNAVSLTYTLPMGTHDLGISPQDIEMRPAKDSDRFIPFGATESENVPTGEVVYAVDNQVRTRRWTWRQSEVGKIGADTHYVFFPIDGFIGVNDDSVRQAASALAEMLEKLGAGKVKTGFVDKANPEMDLSLDE